MYPLRYMGEGEFKAPNAYHARALDKALIIGEVLDRKSTRLNSSHRL